MQGKHGLLFVPFATSIDEHFVLRSFLSFRKSAFVHFDPLHPFFTLLERHLPGVGVLGPVKALCLRTSQPAFNNHAERLHLLPTWLRDCCLFYSNHLKNGFNSPSSSL